MWRGWRDESRETCGFPSDTPPAPMRCLVCLLPLLAAAAPHVRAQGLGLRVNAGPAVVTTGIGVVGEVGVRASRWSGWVQRLAYANIGEDSGEGLSLASDGITALMGGFRPEGKNLEFALGVGQIDSKRFVDCNDGEGGACGRNGSGLSLHGEFGWAPRGRFGVGVRMTAIASRPLSGVGAALTVGVH